MALINIPTDHIKLRKTLSFEKKPLMMLKDYLRDDLSSCSSSGFKSFPRRQCCTTIRYLLEADLKKSKEYSSSTRKLLRKTRSNKPPAASTAISALQRASEAVLNAVKQLPFASVKSSSSPSLRSNSSSSRKGILPRSFSRKLFKRSFWRKVEKEDAAGEIRRWRMFREFLEEKNQPSDQNTIITTITNANANATDSTSSTIITASRVSTSTSSNSWAESEFTADVLQSSSGNSESSSENEVVQGKTAGSPEENKVSNSNTIGVIVGEDSINYTKQEQDWRNEEGKEQFSPVSILDCPFDDEEDINTSPNFQHQLARVEGTKQKLMQKLRRFESLAQLEPVDLEKRIALMSETEVQDDDHQPLDDDQSPNLSTDENHQQILIHTEINQHVDDVGKLLKLFKAQIPTYTTLTFKVDKLLIDLFEEDSLFGHNNIVMDQVDEALKVAEAWMNGNPQEVILGWEVEEGRKLYVKEMERNQKWGKFDVDKEELGSEIELGVFTWLLDELLTDLF